MTPSTTDGEERANSLDDKLREILEEHDNNYDGASDEETDNAIAQIKQAFADEGHIQMAYNPVKQEVVGKPIADVLVTTNEMMTGQEWYDRFQSEIEKTNVTTDFVAEMGAYKELGLKAYETAIIYAVTKLDEAAKRAAGITNEPEAS